MKSLSSILFALVISTGACGGDSASTGVDPMSLMPKLPPAQVVKPAVTESVAAPVTPAAIDLVMPTKFEDALEQGRAFAAKGEHAQAKEMFEAAIKLDKKRAEPHIELARLFITSGDRALAVAAANKGVKLAPLSSSAWNTKGRAELARFDYDAAIEAFSKSVELNRDNVWAWNNLGYTELQLKKYDEAVEHLTEATTRQGATGFMFNNLGTALEQLDRLDEARTAFDAGIKLGSKESVASRKRLEGVKSIALAKTDTSPTLEPKVKTFSTNEGQMDEDQKSTGDEKDAKPETKDESKDVKPETKDESKDVSKPETKAEADTTDDDADEDAGVSKPTM